MSMFSGSRDVTVPLGGSPLKRVVDGSLRQLLAFPLKLRRPGRAPPMHFPHLRSMAKSSLFRTAVFVSISACALGVGGCGNALYAIQVNSASSKLEEAAELGAEEYAPYEYWFALQHIDKAQTEASEGDYSDAVKLAEIGEEYADKAIQLARDAHRGAGR